MRISGDRNIAENSIALFIKIEDAACPRLVAEWGIKGQRITDRTMALATSKTGEAT